MTFDKVQGDRARETGRGLPQAAEPFREKEASTDGMAEGIYSTTLVQ